MSQELDTMTANGTLPVSRRDREPWHPPTSQDRTYTLAPLTMRERAAVARAVVGAVGTYPTDEEFRETLREAALAALEPEDAAQAVRVLDELAALEVAGDQTDDEVSAVLTSLRKQVDRLQGRLSRQDARVRELIAARSGWLDTWIDYTARATIRGWDGLEAPCVRRQGLVTTEAMLAVPDDDLAPLFARCQAVQEVSREQEPGSASP